MSEGEKNLQSTGLTKLNSRRFPFQTKPPEKPQQILKKYKSFFENYRIIDCRSLCSIRLRDNELFQTLIAEIEKFNQEVRDVTEKKTESAYFSWKYALYTGLKNFLRIACDTQDSHMQQAFLEKISKWFQQQLQSRVRTETEPPSPQKSGSRNHSPLRQTSPEFSKMLLNPVASEKLSMSGLSTFSDFRKTRDSSIEDKQQFAEKVKERSQRASFGRSNSPGRRLTKLSLSQASICDASPTRPGTSQHWGEESIRSNSPLKSQYWGFGTRLSLMPEGQNDYLPTDRTITDDNNNIHERKDELSGNLLTEIQETKKQFTEPDEKPTHSRSAERKPIDQDKLIGHVGLVGDQLVPIPNRTTNMFYRPSKEIEELTALKDWKEWQKRRVIKNQEREEMHKMIDEWAHTKSRIAEEAARKREALRYGSRLENSSTAFPAVITKQRNLIKPHHHITGNKVEVRHLPKVCFTEPDRDWSPQKIRLDFNDEDENSQKESICSKETITVYKESTETVLTPEKSNVPNTVKRQSSEKRSLTLDSYKVRDASSIEQEARRTKLKIIRGLLGPQINVSETVLPEENKRHPLSMSIISQNKRLEGESIRKQRHLSSITKSMESLSYEDGQLEEINQVKQALDKSQISVSSSALLRGLMPFGDSSKQCITPVPCIGSRLMNNPFLSQRKSRKKKL